MLCGQRRTGPKFTSVMRASLIYWVWWEHFVQLQTEEKLKPKCVKKSVKGEGGRFGGCSLQREFGLLYSYMAECKCWSEPPLATCGSFPAYIAQSACNFHAGQYSHHTAKWVKQFLEAENIEVMKWPGRCPHLNLIENLWKILGDSYGLKKTLQSPNCGRRVEQDHTRAVWETSDVLWPHMCWSHSKQGSLHFLLI